MAVAAAGLSLPALAQPKHEIDGKIVQLDAAAKHGVVEAAHGRRYRQPLAVGSGSHILLPGGAGTLDRVHVGDEVVVRATAPARPGPRSRRCGSRSRRRISRSTCSPPR